MALLQLGSVQFDVQHLNFKSLSESKEWNFSQSQGIKGSEFVQFLGKKNKRYSISGDSYLSFNDATASLAKLEKMANTGKGFRLIQADGKNLGLFVITSLKIDKQEFNKWGKPLKQHFDISLLCTT